MTRALISNQAHFFQSLTSALFSISFFLSSSAIADLIRFVYKDKVLQIALRLYALLRCDIQTNYEIKKDAVNSVFFVCC